MKSHKKVTLTLDNLLSYRACFDGREAAAPFLPAKISTDWEENVELAEAFVEYTAKVGLAAYDAINFAEFLWVMVRPAGDRLIFHKEGGEEFTTYAAIMVPDEEAPYIIAQLLAWYADDRLTLEAAAKKLAK